MAGGEMVVVGPLILNLPHPIFNSSYITFSSNSPELSPSLFLSVFVTLLVLFSCSSQLPIWKRLFFFVFVFSTFVLVFMCLNVLVKWLFVRVSLRLLSLFYFPAHPSFQFGRGLSRAMQSTWVAPVNARTPKYRRQKSRRRPIFSLGFKRFKAC